MSKIEADVEALRELVSALGAWAEGTQGEMARLSARVREMGSEDWRDYRYQEFCQDFVEVETPVNVAVEKVRDDLIPFVQALITKLEDY